jgi:hypothetical protein
MTKNYKSFEVTKGKEQLIKDEDNGDIYARGIGSRIR